MTKVDRCPWCGVGEIDARKSFHRKGGNVPLRAENPRRLCPWGLEGVRVCNCFTVQSRGNRGQVFLWIYLFNDCQSLCSPVFSIPKQRSRSGSLHWVTRKMVQGGDRVVPGPPPGRSPVRDTRGRSDYGGTDGCGPMRCRDVKHARGERCFFRLRGGRDLLKLIKWSESFPRRRDVLR